MEKRYFVNQDSIVRAIWGKPDTILFIFAGAAAEFALNKSVDWLFFTGRLPADPLGRLFSTVQYARLIVFSTNDEALRVIDRMASIHHQVEQARSAKIPAYAYRDVLYMLIDYSIRAYELLERQLTLQEKAEVYDVFGRVGRRMGIPDLPIDFVHWLPDREQHLRNDLEVSQYSVELFKQYRKHLGWARYKILLAAQGVIVPDLVRDLLKLASSWWAKFAISAYRQTVKLKLDWYLKLLILPRKYIDDIKKLEIR